MFCPQFKRHIVRGEVRKKKIANECNGLLKPTCLLPFLIALLRKYINVKQFYRQQPFQKVNCDFCGFSFVYIYLYTE